MKQHPQSQAVLAAMNYLSTRLSDDWKAMMVGSQINIVDTDHLYLTINLHHPEDNYLTIDYMYSTRTGLVCTVSYKGDKITLTDHANLIDLTNAIQTLTGREL